MIGGLHETYKVMALMSGFAMPATILDDGISAIEKGGIMGLLLLFTGLFYGLMRSAEKAKWKVYESINSEHKERIAKLEAELELERAKKSP